MNARNCVASGENLDKIFVFLIIMYIYVCSLPRLPTIMVAALDGLKYNGMAIEIYM